MSSSVNEELMLQPNDRYEIAFSKLEKAIIDNELISINEFITLDSNKVDRIELIEYVDSCINSLTNKIIDNELVIASTFSYIDNLIKDINKTIKDDEYVIAQSLISLNSSIMTAMSSTSEDVLSLIDNVSNNIIREIIEDELAISQALNVLNTSINNIDTSINNIDTNINNINARLNNLNKLEIITNLTSTLTIDAYKIYKLGTVDQTVTITFDTTTEIPGYSADYTIIFTADSGCSILLPNTCLYANNVTPVYVAGRTYEINISNNLVVVTSFY